MEAAELTRRREALGLSRAHLARWVGVSVPTVWRWETEGRKPIAAVERILEQTLTRLERHRAQAARRARTGDRAMSETVCWSCTGPVGDGYRVAIYMTDVEISCLEAHLCYPCFRTVNRVFGEQGAASLRHEWVAQAPAEGDG